MTGQPEPAGDQRSEFMAFYDRALPYVYGYLSARCRPRALAEDLTAETFLAALDAARADPPPPLTTPWIIGVARHKLADHWRREARREGSVRLLVRDVPTAEDDWDVHLDAMHARLVLDLLAPVHRAALTLRYLDGLSVPQVAGLLGRTVHATEALLVRARAAFRRVYCGEDRSDD